MSVSQLEVWTGWAVRQHPWQRSHPSFCASGRVPGRRAPRISVCVQWCRRPVPLPFFSDGDPADYSAGKVFRFTGDCPWYVTDCPSVSTFSISPRYMIGIFSLRRKSTARSPFARRNRYRAEVLGRTRIDRWLKTVAGSTVNATITTWGGTFVVITADFDRAKSRFLIATQPLENGHTLCEGIVFAKRRGNRAARLPPDSHPLVLGAAPILHAAHRKRPIGCARLVRIRRR